MYTALLFTWMVLDIISSDIERGNIMCSLNKKRKAKNSYMRNGGEKIDGKMKRLFYFTKRQRNQNSKVNKNEN